MPSENDGIVGILGSRSRRWSLRDTKNGDVIRAGIYIVSSCDSYRWLFGDTVYGKVMGICSIIGEVVLSNRSGRDGARVHRDVSGASNGRGGVVIGILRGEGGSKRNSVVGGEGQIPSKMIEGRWRDSD